MYENVVLEAHGKGPLLSAFVPGALSAQKLKAVSISERNVHQVISSTLPHSSPKIAVAVLD